jgi:capsular polysaccharide biosynthesis protein
VGAVTERARTERSGLGWWGFGALAPLTLFIAAGLVLVATVAGYEVAARRSPTYVAMASTMLDQPLTVAQSQDAGVVDKLSRLRLKYAGIVRSDKVVAAAAVALGGSRDEVASREFARVDDGSLLLYIGATGTSRQQAVRTANALANALAAYVTQEQRSARIAARDQVELEVVAPARGARQVLPTTRQKLLSAFGSGLFAFVVLGGVLDLIRRRAR